MKQETKDKIRRFNQKGVITNYAFFQRFLDLTWRNIWWWRVVAILNTVLLFSFIAWMWFEILPDYTEMYNFLEHLGHIN